MDIHIDAVRNEIKTMNRSSSEESKLDLKLKKDIDQVPRFGMRFAFKPEFENMNISEKAVQSATLTIRDTQKWESGGVR